MGRHWLCLERREAHRPGLSLGAEVRPQLQLWGYLRQSQQPLCHTDNQKSILDGKGKSAMKGLYADYFYLTYVYHKSSLTSPLR